jgi:hypothetical protein
MLERILAAFTICATALLIAAPAPTMAATPDFASMTVAQRLALPPDTVVHLPNGRTVTIGALLSEHQARLARFSSAGSIHPVFSSPRLISDDPAIPPKALQPGVTTGAKSLASQLFPVAGTAPSSKYAGDYQAVCTGATSLCLYIPGGVPYIGGNGEVDDFDFLIDKTQCSELKAQWVSSLTGSGCDFVYPTSASVSYFPGLPASATVTTQACSAMFKTATDVHGVTQLTFKQPQSVFFTLPQAETCYVEIMAPKPPS